MKTIGIDIGGTRIKFARMDDGDVHWTGASDAYERPSTEQVRAALRAAGITAAAGDVDAVGLCVPGLLDERRESVALAVNVPGLNGVPLRELAAAAGAMTDRLFVTTDANACAYDLFVRRRTQGRLLVLSIGTGVGAAVLDDGVPLFVDGESPGRLGQCDVSIEGEPVVGPDGGAGSLEGYMGAAALARRYGGDTASVIGRLRVSDPPLRALVRAIRIAHAIYRPRHVWLAGGIGIRLGHLLADLKAAVDTDLTRVARPEWTLSTGDSEFQAAIGAARLAAHGGW